MSATKVRTYEFCTHREAQFGCASCIERAKHYPMEHNSDEFNIAPWFTCAADGQSWVCAYMVAWDLAPFDEPESLAPTTPGATDAPATSFGGPPMSDRTAISAQCHCFTGTAHRTEHEPHCPMYPRARGLDVAASALPFPKQGWECPVCHMGNAPWMAYCAACDSKSRRATTPGATDE